MRVRLTPGAGSDRIDGAVGGILQVRVAARPVDGAANEALMRLVADALDVPRSRLAIRTGERSRVKLLRIEGVPAERLRSLWPGVDV